MRLHFERSVEASRRHRRPSVEGERHRQTDQAAGIIASACSLIYMRIMTDQNEEVWPKICHFVKQCGQRSIRQIVVHCEGSGSSDDAHRFSVELRASMLILNELGSRRLWLVYGW